MHVSTQIEQNSTSNPPIQILNDISLTLFIIHTPLPIPTLMQYGSQNCV